MAQQSLEVLIKAIDGYSPTFGKFGNDLDTMKQKLSSLDSQFGESSNFGKMMKIMQGGGAAAGLNMAGRVLEDVTGKAIELRDALDAGEITAGEMADELARSVPILGNIYSAGANIHELITGAQAELRRTLSVEQSIEDANLMQVRHWREIQSQISAAADEIDKYNDRIIRAGLDAPGLARFDLGQKFEGEESAANTKRQKLIEDAKAQFEYLGDDPKNKGTSKAPASGTIRD
ncbi:MAG TPA: hypothetical protein PK402_11300, partial [Tepidisphaeraceae bacterium]|nr:hypothetical protein [Tepidisphaeraceae bacterium]